MGDRTICSVSDIRVGDEIDWYVGGINTKRCKVLRRIDQGDRVILIIRSLAIGGQPRKVELRANATVSRFNRSHLDELADRIEESVVQVLRRNPHGLPHPDIAKEVRALGQKCRYGVVEHCLMRLEREQKAFHRIGFSGGCKRYWRLAIPKEIGIPVCELKGTRSKRLGRVIRWQRQGLIDVPVVKWLVGGESMSHPCRLELASGVDLQAILDWENRGDLEIPDDLLEGLYRRNSRGFYVLDRNKLLKLSEYMGWTDGGRFVVNRSELQNRAYALLDSIKPNWKQVC